MSLDPHPGEAANAVTPAPPEALFLNVPPPALPSAPPSPLRRRSIAWPPAAEKTPEKVSYNGHALARPNAPPEVMPGSHSAPPGAQPGVRPVTVPATALADEFACQGIWRLIEPGRVRRRHLARAGCWHNGLSRGQARLKRGLDLLLLLLLAMPAGLVCLACMAAIRLDSPGPSLFAQWRTGKDGKLFRFWKLRTMVVDAEAMEERLRPMSRLAWPDFKIERDPRVTRLGRWLRRTSLDELPQLWNVLRGEMSLVGPRPTSFGCETWQLWQTERLAVQPGMTGLWQVLGRGSCSFDQRLRQDLAYIRAWRLGLDLQILWLTLAVVITGKGGK